MTAVIYARYSSDNQREESIEGQIRECTAYAEKNGITIVKHYIDRAISAKTDNRPEFQQMIKDSDKKLFDIVLVWKLDRFARNRYDSARYKTQLKKNGVKLMSATEIISEGPEGIILESVLEGYAEYYSADLAEKVVRGQTENILKGRCNGGRGTFGYTLDSERKFHIDPLTSPFVLESFKKYNEGSTMKEIRDWLNENGIKNPVGGAFTYNSVEHMLKNRRYIGELKFRDVVVPDAIPPIIPLELFEDVQEKIAKNKKAPARRKAEDDYLLTTKLFCGYCGALMFGESGTSRTGEVHRYYKCATAKKHKGCKKKTVRKQWLEDLVVNQTMQLVKDDAAMESIIAKVMELQNKENTNIPLYEKQLRDAESGIQNMLNAIQAGILTSSTKERLEQLEETKRELEARIAEEKLAKPKVTEEFIRFWLLRFRKLDMSLKDQRQALVDTFINAIYLYDDKVLITFNYKEGTQTVTFGEATEVASEGNGSDLDCFTAPENAVKSKDFMAFLFCKPWVHGFCTVFARSVLSMSDDVGRCIALQSVPFFASGEQCQAQFCLHFRVGILEQFQKSRHGDGGFATDLLRDFLRRAQLLHHDLQSGAGLLPGCGPAGARAAGFSADTPGALPLQLRHRIGGRYPEPDHHPTGKGSRGGETIRDRSGAAGHRPGGRERRNPYSRPSSSIRRTSCRLAHSAVYRRRISSSGWARSGTITVTKPPAAPARTPL